MFKRYRSGIAFLALAVGIFIVAWLRGGVFDSYPLQRAAAQDASQTAAYINAVDRASHDAVIMAILLGFAATSAIAGLGFLAYGALASHLRCTENGQDIKRTSYGIVRLLATFALVVATMIASSFGTLLKITADPTLQFANYKGPLASSATVTADSLANFSNGRMFYSVGFGFVLAFAISILIALVASTVITWHMPKLPKLHFVRTAHHPA